MNSRTRRQRDARRTPPSLIAAVLALTTACAGCARNPANPDPWEKTNRVLFALDGGLDRYALEPVANAYTKVVPRPVRVGIGNGFDNLRYGNVVVNDFLQGRWKLGFQDAARMGINSTVGIAGIFDVATRWGLKSHENDFGVTLGKWGLGPGPYLVLPLFGPSTFRDAPDLGFSLLTDPTVWLDLPLAVALPLAGTNAVDMRARQGGPIRFVNRAAVDPYVFTRELYLRHRESLIHPGMPTAQPDLYEDEDAPRPTSRPAS
jgi:phospholipid-binding lipoprotein MlaA